MKKIKSFSKSYLTQWAIFQLFSDLLHHIKSSENQVLNTFIARVLEAFEKAFEEYDLTLLAAKTADAPVVFDQNRDWGIRELYSIAKVYEDYFLDENKQEAARFFLDIFKRYGSGNELAQLAQDKQSGAMTNVLQQLMSDAAEGHASALAVEPLISFIDENNTAFINARRAVTEENMKLAGQVKVARTAAEKAWDNLRAAINGYAVVNEDDADCLALIDSLNATIEHHQQVVRRGKAAKPKDEGETGETVG